MATIITASEILAGQGWYAVPSWAIRASDGAFVWRIEWHGGKGEPPLAGWFAEDGGLTQDISQALPFPQMGGPAVVPGAGKPQGALLGTIVVEPTDTAAVAATWAASNGYTPTAGPSSQLRGPIGRADTQLGFVANYRRGSNEIVKAIFVPYGVGGDYPIEISDAGEAVTLRYVVDDAGTPPHFVVVPKAGQAVGESTTISLYTANAATDAAISGAELSQMQTDILRLKREYDSLARQAGPSGSPVVTTQITSFDLSGRTLTLNWTRNNQAQTASVNLPQTHNFELVADAADVAAASTTETLLATAAITVGASNFVAGDVLAYANGAWTKVINLGDKAHTIPPDSIGENLLTSQLRAKLQNLLTTGDVDHEIVAKTEGYGLKGTTDRIPEKRLPLKADNFLDALSGGTWSDSTTAKVAIVSVANPANIEQEPFATQLSGPRYTNDFYAIELPEHDSLSLRRIAVGDSDNYWQLIPASAWTEREHDGGFRYYTVPFADLPASSVVRVQELAPFELDHEILGLTEFTETQRDGLIALLDNPLPVPTAQQVGFVPKVGADRRYALEKEVRVGGTKLLSGPGAGIAIVTHTASRRDTFNLFRPTGGQSVFDLDAAGQDRDRFLFVSAVLNLTGRRSTSISFERGLTAVTSTRISGFIHLDDVLAAAAFDTNVQTNINGFLIAEAQVWLGSATESTAPLLTTHQLWVAREATTNDLGYYWNNIGGESVPVGTSIGWNVGSTIRAFV